MHFRNHRNKLIGLDFIMKVAGATADCLQQHDCCDVMQWAYSVREVVNCNKLKSSVSGFSYTAPTAISTALSKRVNKLGLTFFYSTFLNVFYFVHVF